MFHRVRILDTILIAHKYFINCKYTVGLTNLHIFLRTTDVSEKPVKMELRSEGEKN